MGIDELPVDGVLRRFAEDREATWIAFNELVQRVVVGVARRAKLQFADVEDLRDVVMLRLVVDDFAALRRGDSATRCAAWIGGVARNVLREQRRRDRRDRTMRELRSANRRDQRVPDDLPRNRLELEALTATQKAVVGCILDGASERQTAAILGMTRDRVHDIKRRALVRLRRGPERIDAPDRT